MPVENALQPKPRKRAGTTRSAAKKAAGRSHASPLEKQLLTACPHRVEFIDARGKVQLMNTTGLTLLEVDGPDQFKGKRWLSMWPREMRNTAAQALEDAKGGTPALFSGYSHTCKGKPKWWEVKVSPIKDERGELLYFIAVSRDVTPSRVIEQSFCGCDERFLALANHIDQLAWMSDAAGNIFWYNQRWFDYTGIPPEEMLRHDCTHVIHPDHLQRVTGGLNASFQSGDTWEDTFPIQAANKEYRWFLSRAMPMRDKSGTIILWSCTCTDITEQLLAMRRLEKLARVIELSHEAILIWDPETGIVIWNRGCEELYGYGREEAIGEECHELLKTRYPMGWEKFKELIHTNRKWSGELLQTARDGREVWVDSRQEFITVLGRSVVLETNRDISERRIADGIRDLLVNELNHRVSNMLAIVQSIAAQTARCSNSTAEFVPSFIGRLQSLSTAHNLLTDAHWSGASISDVIRSQVAVTVGGMHNIDLEGAEMYLPAQTALQLTLVLHELATNAVKHGALSVSTGRVRIAWEIEHPLSPKVHITWTERGGPPVSEPRTAGFGMTLIKRSGQLPHMQAKLEFAPDGVACRIAADLQPDMAFGAAAHFNYFNPNPCKYTT